MPAGIVNAVIAGLQKRGGNGPSREEHDVITKGDISAIFMFKYDVVGIIFLSAYYIN